MELVRNNTAHYKCIRDEFTEAQNGLCAICLKTLPTKRNLDHCHATGMIRGVLCNSCNVMLGWYETRRKAIETYLANAAHFAAYQTTTRKPAKFRVSAKPHAKARRLFNGRTHNQDDHLREHWQRKAEGQKG